MIETRLLHYFVTIAETGNMTKAAQLLHVTQPTLSKQIMALEAQLGKPLFLRGKRRMILTEEGRFLHQQAQEVLALLEKTEAGLSSPQPVGGKLCLGCAETPAMARIAGLLRALHNAHPAIQFQIFSGNTESVIARLDKGLLDVGILQDPILYDRFDYRKLSVQDRYGLLMPQDHPLAQKDHLTLDDLDGLPLFFPTSAHATVTQEALSHRRRGAIQAAGTYTLLYNVTFLVEAGLGCAFCLEGLYREGSGQGLTFRLFDPPIQVDLMAVTKRFQNLSPAARAFLSLLESELQPL